MGEDKKRMQRYRRADMEEIMQNRKIIKTAFVFLLAVGIAIGAGFYREVNEAERSVVRLQIPHKGVQTETLDIARQGMLKRYWQPGVVSFSIKGKIDPQLNANVQLRFTGAQGYVSQGSKKSCWKEIKDTDNLQVRKNGVLPVNIEIDIPREDTKRYQVGSAELEFLAAGQSLSKVKLYIINSGYANY